MSEIKTWNKSLDFWDISPLPSPEMQNLELYDYNTPGAPKRYWRRDDLPSIFNYLIGFKENLIQDFLQGHSSLEEAIKVTKLSPIIGSYRTELMDIDISKLAYNTAGPNLNGWRGVGSYVHKKLGHEILFDFSNYPTANAIVEEFKGNVGIVTYVVLDPNTIIGRHTDNDNRDGEYLRIHIPLIIPEGDVFFECFGEITKWDDIFGFNNQLVHSAYNYTDKHRLVFVIDLRKTAIGLEPGEPFDEKWQIHAKPFKRDKQ
jgi:hypothetical protein